MSPDDGKPVKLTPEQMERWKELGWGESDEEFDRRLKVEQSFHDKFNNDGFNSGFIPDEKPKNTLGYHRFNLSLDWFKNAFKRWIG